MKTLDSIRDKTIFKYSFIDYWIKLESLALSNSVNDIWVPGYSGVRGIEKADKMTVPSSSRTSGWERYLPITKMGS